jgi:hypothetical protein
MTDQILTCPQCDKRLGFATTLTIGEGPAAVDAETFDVGRCPECCRQLFRSRNTGQYRALPWEPLCPDCGDPVNWAGSGARMTAPRLEPRQLLFSCTRHPQHFFAWHPGTERWMKFEA